MNGNDKEEVVSVLREHFDRYYSANNMKLVILGKLSSQNHVFNLTLRWLGGESIEVLESWAYQYFGNIKNKQVPPLYEASKFPPGISFIILLLTQKVKKLSRHSFRTGQVSKPP